MRRTIYDKQNIIQEKHNYVSYYRNASKIFADINRFKRYYTENIGCLQLYTFIRCIRIRKKA